MDLITPMLATPSSSASSRPAIAIGDVCGRPEWLAQEKVEGICALLYSQDGEIRLISRTVLAWASMAVVYQVVRAQTDAALALALALALAGHPLFGYDRASTWHGSRDSEARNSRRPPSSRV